QAEDGIRDLTVTGVQTCTLPILARADKISQAHFFADAHEKPRTEIAARLVDQFQRRSILAENVPTAKPDHQYALRFFLQTFDRQDRRERLWLSGVGEGKLARFHFAQRIFEKLAHFCRLHIAENGDDAIARDEISIAKGEQLLSSQLRDGIRRAFAAQGVGMIAKERFAQNISSNGRELLFVLLDPG